MTKIGHFGTPALVAGGAALLMLILHLAVPFGIDDHTPATNDAGLSDEAVSRGDVADRFGDQDLYGPASPGLALTGTILALVGGLLMVVLGFVPMPVLAARFAGWLTGLLGMLGAFMALTSSAYWLGTGFTTLLGVVSGNPHDDTRFWVLSPVLVAGLAFVALLYFLRVMAGVCAKRDGLRDQAQHLGRGVVLASLALVVLLLVPWSFHTMDGDERRQASGGLCPTNTTCEGAIVWYSAWGHSSDPVAGIMAGGAYGGIVRIAENTDGGAPGHFQSLAFSIKVLTAMGWVGALVGALATLGPLLSSAFRAPGAAKWTPVVLVANGAMLLWGAIQFILASAYQWKPSWDDQAVYAGTLVQDQSWWYAFLPLLAVPLLVLWGLNQFRALADVFQDVDLAAKAKGEGTHSFD